MVDDNYNDPLKYARKLIEERFPEINEYEAIAYARGFTKGMKVAGKDKNSIEIQLGYWQTQDRLLAAGVSYMGLNLTESIVREANIKTKERL